MTQPRLLIAGIGNIFFGDDAFGSEVARRLLRRTWPQHVRVVDFGIRSIDLVYALADGYDVTILIDAAQRGQQPGTVSVIEPNLSADQLPTQPNLDGHTMNPLSVLAQAQQIGANLHRVLLVACEPATLGEDQGGTLGLSDTVQAAIPTAVQVVERLVNQLSQEIQSSTI